MFLIGNENRKRKSEYQNQTFGVRKSEYENRCSRENRRERYRERERERETYLLLQEVARLQPRESGREKKKEWGR